MPLVDSRSRESIQVLWAENKGTFQAQVHRPHFKLGYIKPATHKGSGN